MLSNNPGVIKLRKCKRKLEKINKIISSNIDFGSEGFIESATLTQMTFISEIDELLTDVIYYIIDNQNTRK